MKSKIFAMIGCVSLLCSLLVFGVSAAGLTEAGKELQKYDLNGDGRITISDVTALLDFLSYSCGHEKAVLSESKDATCTVPGQRGGSYCKKCKQVLEETEEIPAKGHNFVGGSCTVCGEVQSSEGLAYILDGDSYIVTGMGTCEDVNVFIPNTYKGRPVSAIADNAFKDFTQIKSVMISDSVKRIGRSAFYGCTELTSVAIGKGVTSIGDSAFYKCLGLTSITIPNSVTNIERYAFCYCSGLTNVIIGNGVTNIGNSAFYGCTKIVSITIPFVGASKDSSENSHFGYIFGASSYSDNSSSVPISLKTVIISSGTTIGDYAFYYCSHIACIDIPDSVKSIGNYAFSRCSRLTSIVIPDGVIKIGDGMFSYCDDLTIIAIPDSVESIGNDAFRQAGLESVTIPDSVTSMGESVFFGCMGLTKVIVGNQVKSIERNTFSNCYRLTTITVGNSIMSIGEYAFSSCSSLTSIVIPDNVTNIGKYAFSGCSSLTNIYCEAGSKPANWNLDWKSKCSATVHWGDEWEYVNGVPTLK